MSNSLTVYVLGPSGSGKTNLLRQLYSMCEGGTLHVCPTQDASTKGQEVHSFVIHAPQEKEATCAVECHELGGEMAPVWEKFILSQIGSMKSKRVVANCALMFVVDALSPHLLPSASVMFTRLKGPGGVCQDWPAVVLLNKALAKNVMTKEELEFFLPAAVRSDTEVLAVDSWNGLGLGDVVTWISNTALSSWSS